MTTEEKALHAALDSLNHSIDALIAVEMWDEARNLTALRSDLLLRLAILDMLPEMLRETTEPSN